MSFEFVCSSTTLLPLDLTFDSTGLLQQTILSAFVSKFGWSFQEKNLRSALINKYIALPMKSVFKWHHNLHA